MKDIGSRRILCVFLLGGMLTVWFTGFCQGKDNDYVTSERCGSCHQIQYKGWIKTFHSTVVQDARKNPEAILADLNDPDLPFRREDILFTIGGHWDQRYLTKIRDDYFVLPRLWSVQSKKWRPYSTYGWMRRPYSKYCVGCHSIGFDPETKKIVEHSIGCESCHGPGRTHTEEPKTGNIVNPRRLPKARAEEICASCHVRGMDVKGEYFFPVGYKPGAELSQYLIPLEKREGESNIEAIHRLWEKWLHDRETQARSRCEVCGIHQKSKPKRDKVRVDQLCLKCHEYEDRLEDHTKHSKETVECSDCHQQKNMELNENKDNNVHSYGYFLIHPQNCWDQEIYRKCSKCHSDETQDWAYDVMIKWGVNPQVIIDH